MSDKAMEFEDWYEENKMESMLDMSKVTELGAKMLMQVQAKQAWQAAKEQYSNPQPQKVEREPEIEEGSETNGMNLGERIAHVGGRENAAGYIEFGSVMAVQALIAHVLRDIGQPKVPQGVEEFIATNTPTLCDVVIAGKKRGLSLDLIETDAVREFFRTLMAGKVLVPVEPSPKMIDATFNDEIETSGEIESHNTRNRRIYKAMLTASKEEQQ